MLCIGPFFPFLLLTGLERWRWIRIRRRHVKCGGGGGESERVRDVALVGTGNTRARALHFYPVVTALRVGRVTNAGRDEMGDGQKISFCGITEFM